MQFHRSTVKYIISHAPTNIEIYGMIELDNLTKCRISIFLIYRDHQVFVFFLSFAPTTRYPEGSLKIYFTYFYLVYDFQQISLDFSDDETALITLIKSLTVS